uniref:Low molecular weight phosphotyrosine protein phosphatase n=1 Tax=Phallusia mammillata TaxID=59560 RepID=A0A6F9D5X1_9ASCI|nr:low molecular weight phosphotyrosine protein phosphatase-like [Phallusia mammillata]
MEHSVLFVCFGNTCRSPMAEAIFKEILCKNKTADKWHVKSCGVSSIQAGAPPSDHGRVCMERRGIFYHIQDHKAKTILKEDFHDFEFILGMDSNNMRVLKQMCEQVECKANIQSLGSYDPLSSDGVIHDPYGGPMEDYESVYQQIFRSCESFYNKAFSG